MGQSKRQLGSGFFQSMTTRTVPAQGAVVVNTAFPLLQLTLSGPWMCMRSGLTVPLEPGRPAKVQEKSPKPSACAGAEVARIDTNRTPDINTLITCCLRAVICRSRVPSEVRLGHRP